MGHEPLHTEELTGPWLPGSCLGGCWSWGLLLLLPLGCPLTHGLAAAHTLRAARAAAVILLSPGRPDRGEIHTSCYALRADPCTTGDSS